MRALGVIALALQDPSGPIHSSVDIVSLILQADPVVQAVMAILLLFSAASWGIVLYKYRHLARASRQNVAFIGVFRKSSRFSEVQASCASLPASPLVGLFQSGYAELTAQMRAPADRPGEAASRPTLRSMEGVDRALLRASTTRF